MTSSYKYLPKVDGFPDADAVMKITSEVDMSALGRQVIACMRGTDAYIDFGAVSQLVAFQGFNIEYIAGLLYQKAMQARRTDFVGDVQKMIVLYATRGTTIVEKSKASRTKTAGQALIDELVSAYQIVRSGKSSMTAITLARVASCFPHLVMSVLNSKAGRVTGDMPEGLRMICCPQAPACIPAAWKNMKQAHLRWSKNFSVTIKATYDEARQKQFYETISAGSYFSEDDRRKIMSSFGLSADCEPPDTLNWIADSSTVGSAQAVGSLQHFPTASFSSGPAKKPAAAAKPGPKPKTKDESDENVQD